MQNQFRESSHRWCRLLPTGVKEAEEGHLDHSTGPSVILTIRKDQLKIFQGAKYHN